MRYRWLRFLLPTLLALATFSVAPARAATVDLYTWQASMAGLVTHAAPGNDLGATEGSAVSFTVNFQPVDPCHFNRSCVPSNPAFTTFIDDFVAIFKVGNATYEQEFTSGVLGGGDGTLPPGTDFFSLTNGQLSNLQVQFPTDPHGLPAMTIAFDPVFFTQGGSSDGCLNDNSLNAVCGTLDANTLKFQPVPEPPSLALLGLALIGLVGSRRLRLRHG